MGRAKEVIIKVIPSKIDELGAGMYKGERVTLEERHAQGVAWRNEKNSDTSERV